MIEHCKQNGYKFKWVNENNIVDYVDSNLFKGKNKIQLNKMYEGIGYSEQDKD